MSTDTIKQVANPKAWREITDEERAEFYKLLVTHSFAEAATQMGYADFYAKTSLRSIGWQIYDTTDPEKIGISKDVVELVQAAIADRKVHNQLKKKDDPHPIEKEPTAEMIDPKDTKGLVMGGRNKAGLLLHKKMDMLGKNKKALEKENIATLAKVFGIFFDKSQIVQGEATEHVAVLSRNIDENLSPEEMLEMTLKMREQNNIEKHK